MPVRSISTVSVGLVVAVVGGGCDLSGSAGHGSAGRAARVVRDVDGDTIVVREHSTKHVSIRALGIDTPEMHRPGTPVECGGPEASRNLARLARPGNRVRIITETASGDVTDRYGRTIARVADAQGDDLWLAQLRVGWAKVYAYENREFAHRAQYERAAARARRAGRGVYRLCGGDFHSATPGRRG
jgi:micrococcal nuclease